MREMLPRRSEKKRRISEKKISVQQIAVLIGACLYQCAMIGILLNCSGVLFAQIRQELGFTMSRVSVYNTMKSVTTALAAASVTALYFKSRKPIFLLLNQLLTITGFLLLTVGAEGSLWYVSAVICGFSGCVGSVAIPMLLTLWFPDNSGTATGIAMSFSGIGGAICNPLCARLINSMGWKSAIYVLSAVTLALTIPGLLLMFHRPAPEGNAPEKKKIQSPSGRMKVGTVVLVAVVLVGGSLGVTFAVNISMFAQSIGYSLAIGASMTTMIMIGNVCSKFLYGLFCDKVGVWKATIGALAVAMAALLCYLFASGQTAALFAASLLYGCVYALSVVGISRCCIAAYGQQESKRYLGVHTCINSIVMAGASLLVGVLVDCFGSFMPVLLTVFGSMACSMAACLLLTKQQIKQAD